jgi:tetratricopeptide (TPR) repeat protein
MPPWLPTGGDYALDGRRTLSDREIALLRRWADQGAPAGDLGVVGKAEPTDGWILGEPDLTLEMEVPYHLPAASEGHPHGETAQDVFRYFVIPVPLEQARYVRAVEFQPSDRRVVHHVTMSVDHGYASRLEDWRDTIPGFDAAFNASHALQPAGLVLGWTPGAVPRPNAGDLAWPLDPGVDFVIQAHLMPTVEDVDLRMKVGLHFGDPPAVPRPLVKNLYLLGTDIDIPAGAATYTVEDSFQVPVDVEVLGLYPHAHYLARTMHATARLPDGEVRTLLEIGRWDFDWQDMYTFASPVRLPAGTQLSMRWAYDNSGDNPENPNVPPRRVTFGYGSRDEMSELWIQARPSDPGDYAALQAAVDEKRSRDHTALFGHVLRLDPTDASALANLGAVHERAGRTTLAIEHYRRALEQRPDFARAHYELGAIMERQGEWQEAEAGYREAVRVFPEYVAAHLSLGSLLSRNGDLEEARAHYERAAALDPRSGEALAGLGNLSNASGRLSEALAYYRSAVEVTPWAPEPRFSLARALIAAGAADEALRYLEEAAEMAPMDVSPRIAAGWVLAADPDERVRRPELAARVAAGLERSLGSDHPLVLDLLSAAHAAMGDFGRATRLAERAIERAESSGQDALGRSMAERVELYREGKPFISGDGPYATAGREVVP